MALNVIITGSTGMVGKAALIECLESPQVASVLVINRQSLGVSNPKLREIIHRDFFDLSAIQADLQGYNACFFCLGVSSVGISEADYHRITYDLTMHFAQAVHNPDMTFCFVSGMGTDSTEQGKVAWANIKGKTENALARMPFKATYAFRPGFIRPMKGVHSRTRLYAFFITLARPLFGLLEAFPKYTTTSAKLGQALIKSATQGYEKRVLESTDINILAVR
jgi:uncharacterized protein YbjT (DUF2867 family)